MAKSAAADLLAVAGAAMSASSGDMSVPA